MRFSHYLKQSGPGWLQAAVTLGGGSLIGALYLGVIGGYEFMWLQPLAMLCGVIMLGALSHVTLSSGERPFREVKRTISPSLAWAWLIGTVVADTVFCAAQFALGQGAIQQNLGGSSIGDYTITGSFFAVSLWLIWLSQREGSAGRIIENILKVLVAIVVLAFMGVVVKLGSDGAIQWAELAKGFIPDFGALFSPTDSFKEPIAATGESAAFWTDYLESTQRNVIITAFGTAVGINMTFLLPYTLLKRGWGKEQRPLARMDLGFGLFVPFILATAFLIIASASQFHAKNQDVILPAGTVATEAEAGFANVLKVRLKDQLPADASNSEVISTAQKSLATEELELAAMLVKRDAGALANSLEPFLGKAAQPIFGIGVLAMAISTMLVHMMMNGYAISEAFNKIDSKKIFIAGATLPALAGLFSPALWSGKSKAALAVPASVTAFCLLPVAYLAILLLINSKSANGGELPKNRALVNTLLIIASSLATLGAVWVLIGKGTPGLIGIGALAALTLIGIVGFIQKRKLNET